MLANFDIHERSIDIELAKCDANLRAVVSARNSAASRARELLAEIDAFRTRRGGLTPKSQIPRPDQAWHIYASLNGFIEELKRVALRQQIGG
jgi:hypothetical protein